MDITEQKNNYQNLKDFFWEANRDFMERNYVLLDTDLSERCLCGALMCELNKQLEKTIVITIMLMLSLIGIKKELSSCIMTMALLVIFCRIL